MKEFAEKFWAKVNVQGPDECWPWKGVINEWGYGRFMFKNKTFRAHRVAWELTHNLPPTQLILHKCDNPPCCNPKHLFEGSHQDNRKDRAEKEALTAEQFLEVCNEVEQLVSKMVKRFGVRRYVIKAAIRKYNLKID